MTLSDGWPPFYAERKMGADVNVGQLYVAFVAAALAFAFLLVLPGFRGVEVSQNKTPNLSCILRYG